MEGTPPEQMRMLKLDELHQFGLAHIDPVFDEKRVALRAAYFKITSAELRKREVAAEAHCDRLIGGLDKNRSDFLRLAIDCEPDFIRKGGP